MSEAVEFHIVENYSDEDKFPAFREDFINSKLTVKELRDKYNLSRAVYCNFRDRIFNEAGDSSFIAFKRRTQTGGRPKRERRKFNLSGGFVKINPMGNCTVFRSKRKDSPQRSYGTYPDFKTAEDVMYKLMEHNWDVQLASELIKEYATFTSKRCLGEKILKRDK